MKISQLLRKDIYWCQGAQARDKEGNALKNLDSYYLTRFDKNGNIYYQEFHNVDLAYSYSLYGAVIRCTNLDDHERVMDKLSDAVIRYTGKKLYVAEFNDLQDTTFDHIKGVLKIAGI